MAFALKGAGSDATSSFWSATANQASFVITTITTAGAVGDLAVVRYAIDNNQTTDGDEGCVTGVVDSSGTNVWAKGGEFTNGQGGAQAGATCGIWYCNLTAALAVGSTITLSFSNSASRDSSAHALEYFTQAAGSTATLEGTPAGLANDAAAPGSLDVTTSNIACLRIRASAIETNNTTAWTKTAAFNAVLTQCVASSGAGATNEGLRGEYAITTGTGLASAPGAGPTGSDCASIYVAWKEVVAATGPLNSWNNSTDVGGQVAVIARKAAAALLIAASAPSFVPFNTVQPARAANYTNFGWYNPLSPAPKVAKARQGDSFVPFNTAQVVSTATYGWQAPLSVAVRIGGPPQTQPAFVVPPFVAPQGWQAPLPLAPKVAAAQQGYASVPYNTAQLSVNFTNLGWHGPTATAPPVAKPQAGFSFVPFDTRQLSVNFTNYGWHPPTSKAPPVAKPQAGNSFVPYNTAQVAAAAAATEIGVPLTTGSAPPFARVVYAQTTFQPPYAPNAATATGIPLTMGDAPAAARLVYAQTRFEVPYLPPTVVGATGIPLTTGNAPPFARVVYAQTKFDVLYVAPATPALNYTNLGWYAPLSKPAPVAKAQQGYSFVPFNTAQVPAEIGIPLDFGGAAPRYRTVYYQSRFFPPYPTTVVVVAAPNGWQSSLSGAPSVAQATLPDWQLPYSVSVANVFGWQPPLSTPLPLPKPQAGYASVPYNTAQLAVNYQNFGWYAPLAGAPLVAKAQPGSSFVPYNTAQVIVNYTNFGWYQPLSVAAPVVRASQGWSFVPFNTAQLAVNYTNFTWSQPLSVPAPVAQPQAGFSFVPYNTAQIVATPYTAYYQQPLSIAVPVARAAAGFWFVPFDTVQVAPPSELGGTTSLGGGGKSTGGFCRKKWKKCLEEIRQQLADEQASLKAAKQRHEEIDYAARAARIAAIQASAAALEAECAAESLAVASARIERFIDKLARIEADYQAALLRQFEDDEDDVLTMLLT